MGIISGTVSFRGRFGDHFGVGDHFWVGIISGAVQSVCALSSVFEFAYEWHLFNEAIEFADTFHKPVKLF